jgi:hypothetical protein
MTHDAWDRCHTSANRKNSLAQFLVGSAYLETCAVWTGSDGTLGGARHSLTVIEAYTRVFLLRPGDLHRSQRSLNGASGLEGSSKGQASSLKR